LPHHLLEIIDVLLVGFVDVGDAEERDEMVGCLDSPGESFSDILDFVWLGKIKSFKTVLDAVEIGVVNHGAMTENGSKRFG